MFHQYAAERSNQTKKHVVNYAGWCSVSTRLSENQDPYAIITNILSLWFWSIRVPHGYQGAAPPPASHLYSRGKEEEKQWEESSGTNIKKPELPKSLQQRASDVWYFKQATLSQYLLNNKYNNRVHGFYFALSTWENRVQSYRQVYNLRKQRCQLQPTVTRARNYQVRQPVQIPFYLDIIFRSHVITSNVFGVS